MRTKNGDVLRSESPRPAQKRTDEVYRQVRPTNPHHRARRGAVAGAKPQMRHVDVGVFAYLEANGLFDRPKPGHRAEHQSQGQEDRAHPAVRQNALHQNGEPKDKEVSNI